MKPFVRRVVQAALYEGIAIAVVTPTLVLAFSHPPGSALMLSALMSGIALTWNYLFNWAKRSRGAPWFGVLRTVSALKGDWPLS
jgi:uncharacterized membrane protein